MSSGKRQSVTVAQRLEIVQKLEDGVSVEDLVMEYGVSKRTIRRYKKDSMSIRQLSENPLCMHLKRQRTSLYEDMEAELYKWVLKRRALGRTLTNTLLQEKAKELHAEFGSSSNFTASQGWLSRFKTRYNIRLGTVHEEKVDSDERAVQKFINELEKLLIREEYTEENIYNMCESILMWRALPTEALTQEEYRRTSVTKMKRDLVTVAFCANATGKHRLPLLFVNRYANPKALKHCKQILPVVYKYECNGCINERVFSDWYSNHFKVSVRQYQLHEHRKGKVLLLVNHSSAHMIPEELRYDTQFKLVLFPPNVSSYIEPMAQGVIGRCKKLFRHELLRKVLRYDRNIREFYAYYDIKHCIDLITDSWRAVTEGSIKYSWRRLLKRQAIAKSAETEGNDSVYQDSELNQIIPTEQIVKWISECEETESILDKRNVKHESSAHRCPIEDEELDYIFLMLGKWAKTQPELIQLQTKVLVDYYNK
ncbi:PREDICTED: jerky protein homolog-like [Eufriesea mexicana]|uniref:jerky protein homolog-like n=1 Tax=Eufriesea mexicana TaxID=516756 RepID=UPI00083C5587|nr:PREDICTED: jerky protein homolog-like [Eufriesea mexicana]